MIFTCARCRHEFRSTRNVGFSTVPTSPRCDSALYRSNHTLCCDCSDYEHERITDAGTNDIPDLLATYSKPDRVIE